MDQKNTNNCALSLRNLCKHFGSIYANKHVDLDVHYGEILSLLGENGSGKTTLMNMIAGIYYPDEGEIFVDGEKVIISSPKDAYEHGIGMVHQHFKLVDVFTAAENIVLGHDEGGRLDYKAVAEKAKQICHRYGFELDPNKKVYEMTVSEKQTLEIVKVLYRGARILILDEPTAVLTPQETKKLFEVVRNMRADGKCVIIITHKLNEVMELSDRVAVLRKGEYIGDIATKDATVARLTEMMVGEKVELNIRRTEPENTKKRLWVQGLYARNAEGREILHNVSFEAHAGEILGIAGIAGSGQKEILEAIAGLQKVDKGTIEYTTAHGTTKQLVGLSPLKISNLGVKLSFVPEDRLGMGLVGEMDMSDNMMLRSFRHGKSIFTNTHEAHDLAAEIKERLSVATPSLETPVRRLSGGNVQKVLVGREISSAPRVLMTAYAVRGLDINTSYTIYNLLAEQKEKGAAVVYVGEDLDVLIALCDKIVVLCDGYVSGIVDARTATKEQIGVLMTSVPDEVVEAAGRKITEEV